MDIILCRCSCLWKQTSFKINSKEMTQLKLESSLSKNWKMLYQQAMTSDRLVSWHSLSFCVHISAQLMHMHTFSRHLLYCKPPTEFQKRNNEIHWNTSAQIIGEQFEQHPVCLASAVQVLQDTAHPNPLRALDRWRSECTKLQL